MRGVSRRLENLLRVLTSIGTPAEVVIYTAELARSAREAEARQSRTAEQTTHTKGAEHEWN